MKTALRYLGVLSLLLSGGCVVDPAGSANGALDKNTVVRLADRMQQQGDFVMAQQFYQRAVTDDPNNGAAYAGLGRVALAMGEADAAERAYREALRCEPNNADIQGDYARLLLQRGDYPAAITQYQAALSATPDDARLRNGLGVALDQQGDHAGAQAAYRAVLADKATDMTALNNLGMSLLLSGDAAGAVALWAPVADSLQAPPNLRANLAQAQALLGQQPAVTTAPPAAPERAGKRRGKAGRSARAHAANGLLPPPAPAVLASALTAPLPPVPLQAVSAQTLVEDSAPVALPVAEPAMLPPEPEATPPDQAQLPVVPVQSGAIDAVIAAAAPAPAVPVQPTELRAMFGPYATAAMAAARQQELQAKLAGLLPQPTVFNLQVRLSAAKRPRFWVEFYGFAEPAAVKAVCGAAIQLQLPCQAEGLYMTSD
jgi:Flp pilus assembly protein TadD